MIIAIKNYSKIYTNHGSTMVNNMNQAPSRLYSVNGADINSNNLGNILKILLIGKDTDFSVWVSTDEISSKLAVSTDNINWNQIGTIAILNDSLACSNRSNHVILSKLSGVSIGFKIVASTSKDHYSESDFWYFDKWNLTIGSCETIDTNTQGGTVSTLTIQVVLKMQLRILMMKMVKRMIHILIIVNLKVLVKIQII